jgi:hypothetical protein
MGSAENFKMPAERAEGLKAAVNASGESPTR